MNEIIKKVLLAGDKFMPEMYLGQPGFTYSSCGPFSKNKKKEYKNLKKQEIWNIFIKTKQIKLALSMRWLMEILNICEEEQPLIKYHVIKHLTLIWIGFLGVRFELGCIRMLKTSYLARKYAHICSFRKYTFQLLVPRPSYLLMSIGKITMTSQFSDMTSL